MYTEDFEKRGYSIRNVIFKLLIVVILAWIIAKLLPRFIVPQWNQLNGKDDCRTSNCDSSLSMLSSQTYVDNIERMKNSAISYFTSDKLPKELSDFWKVTLKDMINDHIIEELVDKNNKVVDQEKSYVKITKISNGYVLEVYIKDSEKRDYNIFHLDHYRYCSDYLCQKR